jgi:hypothetical protein
VGASNDTAILVASISLAVSITGLFWQLAVYWLSGARLEVRLTPMVMNDFAATLRGPDRGWRRESLPPELHGRQFDVWVDLAVVTVTNVGRAPISVSDIGFDIGTQRPVRRWRRHTVQSWPFSVGSSTMSLHDVRLESGEATRVVMDPWVAIRRRREVRSDRPVILRATAHAAGRRMATRSRWIRRWKIPLDTLALWPHGDPTPRQAAFQEMWRRLKWEDSEASPDLVWYRVRQVLDDGGEKDDIQAALDESPSLAENAGYSVLLSYYIERAFLERNAALEERSQAV